MRKMFVLNLMLFFGCISIQADEVLPYGVSSWPHVRGNHRAIIKVDKPGDANIVKIPWRRRDEDVKSKGVMVFDQTTGRRIKNVYPLNLNREFGEIVFQPATVPGDYAVYYYPLEQIKGRPTGTSDFRYAKPLITAEQSWIKKHGLGPDRYLESNPYENIPKAKAVKIESRTEFDSFYPMEVIATSAELEQLKQFNPDAYLLFPEDRSNPIKMTADLPAKWIKSGPSDSFSAKVKKNENFAFQIGVYAAQESVDDLTVIPGELKNSQGKAIKDIVCINTAGVDGLGKPFKKELNIEEGNVQALWFIVHVPKDISAGIYSGEILIGPKDGEKKKFKLTLDVQNEISADGGVGDVKSFARLSWLNSPIGMEDGITAPYTPMKVNGREISCLGKTVTLGQNGLPTSIKAENNEVLAAPVEFAVLLKGRPEVLKNKSFKITESKKTQVSWQAISGNDEYSLTVNGRMEYDGYAFYSIELKAKKNLDISDAALRIPYCKEIATYMMGLNTGRGEYRKKNVQWKWQQRPNNKVWIGDVEVGLRCKLRGDKELENVWAEYTPEVNGIPQSWSNNGSGGASVTDSSKESVLFKAYSGSRELQAGQEIEFNFSLLITPVKPRDPEHWMDPKAWEARYSMLSSGSDTSKALGAKYVTAFHASPMNPYINYPFLTNEKLKEWVEQIHENGMRAKVYYKIGELSNHCVELPALRSLGKEVLLGGKGGGSEWLQEHVISDYYPKWCAIPYGIESPADASLGTTGMSRWDNYYVSSIAWLVKNMDIDGLYYDGMQGYSRQLIRRVRKVMDDLKPGGMLDFHGGNTITRLSNVYNDIMEHLPYFDSTWIGEGFNYNGSPDFYMVELSGIPFGVPNAMLQYGGNPWRGMLYGMASRYIENMASTPSNVWKFWDKIQIQNSRMIGYWDKNCPVKTGNKDVLATVYKFKDKALIAIASWAKQDVKVNLDINDKALGFSPKNLIAYAPEIPGYQPLKKFDLTKAINIPRGRGWLILLEPASEKSFPMVDKFESQKLKPDLSADYDSDCWKNEKQGKSKGVIRRNANLLTITAPSSSGIFTQRELPTDINGVEVGMKFEGLAPNRVWHDRHYGIEAPGVALVFDNGKILRAYAGSHGVFAIDNAFMDHLYKRASVWENSKPGSMVYIRFWWNDKDIFLQASVNKKKWETVYSMPMSILGQKPVALRLGKMTKDYGWPKTVKITNRGPIQKIEYGKVTFWRKK